MPDTQRILVTGDYGVDYDIYLQSRDPNPRPGADPSAVGAQIGGAALVYRLLAEVARQAQDAGIEKGNRLDVGFRRNAGKDHAFAPTVAALWEGTPSGQLVVDPKAESWRVTGNGVSLGADARLPLTSAVIPPEEADTAFAPDVLVLDDGSTRFRFGLAPVQWPSALQSDAPTPPRWIVLKMGTPACHGDLWWTLASSPVLMDRLVVVVPIQHLRRENVRISQGISWERSVLDLRREITQGPALAGLTAARHAIVTFRGEGAVWIERKTDGELDWHLLFDARLMEDEWPAKMGIRGSAYGSMACFTAALTAHLAGVEGSATDPERIASGIRHGLWSMRLARGLGHGLKVKGVTGNAAGMPLAALAELILAEDPRALETLQKQEAKAGRPRVPQLNYASLGTYGHVIVPSDVFADVTSGARWRILEHAGCADRLMTTVQCSEEEPLYGAARRLTLNGLSALEDVPYAEFGQLVTADRGEIEALRNIKHLMQDYDRQSADLKPLSISVVGPPGSGKSFGIKQIAGEACDPGKLAFLEFNLSQFDDTGDLIGAFHQVRDRVLDGKLPVVFWDEFDSGNYKWLQFLLAPMQDGKFQQGQLTHPIGKCIFVFAGATSHDRENFGPREVPELAEFRLKKGPDFLSRLHGYLNVLGPNQRQQLDRAKPVPEWVDDESDVCFPVRRALLLRALLGFAGKKANARMEMDPGLMAALLEVGHYTHGARSLEKITQSLRRGHDAFHRSDLPSDEVLRMHVKEFDLFKDILGRSRVFEEYAEKLAPAMHDRWRTDKRRKKGNEPFNYDVEFGELPPDVKASNLAAAMRIPQVLELAGLYLVPRQEAGRETDARVAACLMTMRKQMAEEEHILWMAFMFSAGWTPAREGEKRDDARRVHDCLIDYHKLPKDVQDYDVGQVLSYAAFAEAANFVILASKPRPATRVSTAGRV